MTTRTETETPIQTPICTSCNRTIPPAETAMKFQCPSCGEITIWRGQKCRKFGRHYKCPKCGFVGP